MEISSNGRREWLEMDFGLLGSDDGSSGWNGVSGREAISGVGGCKDESRISSDSNGLIVDRRREHRISFMLSDPDPRDELRVRWASAVDSRGELGPSSGRGMVSARLCTPYMLSLGSRNASDASGEGLRSVSEACGLRDRKKVAGAAVRGSREEYEEGGSAGGLREKACRSGTGRIVETFEGS
ncbi:hypothetical protein F1880_007326 [Penicillium rolfsii]|nr:hypothetical protein F1880_007326 [Penicillium rolfsii]